MGVQTSPVNAPSGVASAALEEIYKEALVREGLHPSPELVDRVRQLHLAALTPGLILRAFHAHRQATLRKQQDTNQSTTAGRPSRS